MANLLGLRCREVTPENATAVSIVVKLGAGCGPPAAQMELGREQHPD